MSWLRMNTKENEFLTICVKLGLSLRVEFTRLDIALQVEVFED